MRTALIYFACIIDVSPIQSKPIQDGKLEVFANTYVSENIAVTYNANGEVKDGAGAQLLRLLGFYVVAKALGIHYYHTPLVKVHHAPVLASNNKSMKHWEVINAARWNNVIRLPNSNLLVDSWHNKCVIESGKMGARGTWDSVKAYKTALQVLDEKRPCLVKMFSPFGILDDKNGPDFWYHLRALSTGRPRTPLAVVTVAVHIRRGDILSLTASDRNRRFLPNEYYARIIKDVINVLEYAALPFVVHIFTEAPNEPTIDTFPQFGNFPHTYIMGNTDPIWTVGQFALADVFIMSRSGFSYLGAVLNVNGSIIFPPAFWHQPMPHWLKMRDGFLMEDDKLAIQNKVIG